MHGELKNCFNNVIDTWSASFLAYLYYSQGLITALISLIEPGALQVYLALIKRLFTCRFSDPEEKSIEPINVSLHSTLNIEFVYVILEGIVKISRMNLDGNDG